MKQGIADGFLAPYKVIRVHLDLDLTGWRPERGKTDAAGELVEDRVYNQKDWDRNVVMTKRREIIAAKIAEFLRRTDPFSKTIVFCEDIEHAEEMRKALINACGDEAKANDKYVMKITGDDNIGKAELDNFIHPEEKYPVIATTSRLMSTGVDAKTCKLIVLDRTINSMIEFKQIIGRGTRVAEEFGKTHFTIMDFRNATDNFADPDFDGDPVLIYEPGEDEDIVPPDNDDEAAVDSKADPDVEDIAPNISIDMTGTPRPRKVVIGDVEFNVAVERVEHINEEGKLVTESIRDYTKRTVLRNYAELRDFFAKWTSAEMKSAVVEELSNIGVFFDALAEAVGRDYDPFDLIAHVVFDQPPLTRKERAEKVRKRDYFTKYGVEARAVLDALLDKYTNQGLEVIEKMDVLRVEPIDEIGTLVEIVGWFGGKSGYVDALRELEQALYAEAA